MLTPFEFKQLPEWQKIETAIREILTEHEGNCITAASACDPHAAVESGWCFALRTVLALPDQLLEPTDQKSKTDDPAEGHRIIGHRGPSPRI